MSGTGRLGLGEFVALIALMISLIALAIDAMLRNLARGPRLAGGDPEAHHEALLDFLTGALQAPVTGEPA